MISKVLNTLIFFSVVVKYLMSSDANLLKSLEDISKPMQLMNRNMKMKMLIQSPKEIFLAILAMCVVSFIIHLAVEFFSKNRFRGISWGIFTKLISLNAYIKKFNDQLFEDFTNIHRYVEQYKEMSKSIDADLLKITIFQDGFNNLLTIHGFMKSVEDEAKQNETNSPKSVFNQYLNVFFSPNPQFQSDNKHEATLRQIFKLLYKDDMHDKFELWLSYDSIWNFTYSDERDIIKILLKADFVDKDETRDIVEGIISEEPSISQMKDITEYMKEEVTNILMQKLLKSVVNSYKNDKKDEVKKNVTRLFFSTTNSNQEIEYGSISQQFKENCTLLDDDTQLELINSLNDAGLSDESLTKINKALSFIEVLQRLFEKNYTVTSNLLANIPNVHDHIKSQLKIALSTSHKRKRAMIVYNSCYRVYNELVYQKIAREGVEQFLFLDNNEVKNPEKNILCKHLNLLLNVHTVNMHRESIMGYYEFKKTFKTQKEFAEKCSLFSATHVSIARLKYLIQDYFVIINEYNDKSNPDKEDIRDMWEKRVNAFGFVIPDTKASNRPRDGRDIDYVTLSSERTRSEDVFDEDLDMKLKKNTIWELYKEYARALFIETRHPRIPFFQSIMATIRYLIPEPDVLIDNFRKQLNGDNTESTTTNPINYDFSFKYNPYVDIFAQMREPAPASSAPASRFPAHWGPEPLVQTRDYVPLPGGYGDGSSTLAAWIKMNMAKDAAASSAPASSAQVSVPSANAVSAESGSSTSGGRFPAHWGPEPKMQTRDYGPLPGGYGAGSSTLAAWITMNMAKDAADAEAAEAKAKAKAQAEAQAKAEAEAQAKAEAEAKGWRAVPSARATF